MIFLWLVFCNITETIMKTRVFGFLEFAGFLEIALFQLRSIGL